jgi:hypothetical protein
MTMAAIGHGAQHHHAGKPGDGPPQSETQDKR